MIHFKHSPRGCALISAMASVVGCVAICAALNIVAATSARAQSFQVLYSFSGAPDEGTEPDAPLIQGTDGNFYGTTEGGGPSNSGTVFRMTPDGTVTILHAFAVDAQGAYPVAALLHSTDGNFYGTVTWQPQIFRMTPDGTVTTLYAWPPDPVCCDNNVPGVNGLIQATDGNFYGTTSQYTICDAHMGGPINCYTRAGTAFRVAPDGVYTVLHQFWGGATDGLAPGVGVIQATDGALYTTTRYGGEFDNGTVFRIAPDGTFAVAHSFGGPQGATDGVMPEAPLLQGKDGNLYGTTSGGGPAGYGTIFRIAPDGTFTVLHAFTQSSIDWRFPGLIQATDGNFYGVEYDGANDDIFQLTPDGTFTVLYTFPGRWYPSQLLQGSDGNLYGTTRDDGSGQFLGTVFSLTLPAGTAGP